MLKKQTTQKFEQRKLKVHQRKKLLKNDQYIKKLQGLDRVLLQIKFATPVCASNI